MIARAFQPREAYPELEPLLEHWPEIRKEGERIRPHMIWVDDDRTDGRSWAFAPLWPEEEDRTPRLDAVSADLRSRAPNTVKLAAAIPGLLGCGFSLLLGRSAIGIHCHSNPFVTAMLGLSVGRPCWIAAGPETRDIQSGDILIFDYTFRHQVVNESADDRLVLLVLLPNKLRT
ncbi:MAG TPA: aspartyl/asparaginyl beta-hydroxylase domain-containing protein [Tepidisphaeraceae bacterium]|nr:aspartyl/asparaginyl beta-hydroxylase domain-containing protein [Tepidisphaeraceae bacterium]